MDQAGAPEPETDRLFASCAAVVATDAAWRRTLRRELSTPGLTGRTGAEVVAFIADGHLVRGADALAYLREDEEGPS